MKEVFGGVCAPEGFTASGIHCGIKPTSNPARKDLALIKSDVPCNAAGMFTTNNVKAAPVKLDIEHLKDGRAQAIVANSYIANACAPEGMETAELTAETAGKALEIPVEDIIVSSTGVIGTRLNVEAIISGFPELVASLSKYGSEAAAQAIMTTDTVRKELSYEFTLDGKTAHIGAITKGSGMIHPHMGTMLCYITTDAAISSGMLKEALKSAVNISFNRISVDGDMSTNDTCVILANGLAGNTEIKEKNGDYDNFLEVLKTLTVNLAKIMAKDGEGAEHLITCTVENAVTEKDAETLAKSVINSTLTKTAIFGKDANWGRVLCALGYSGVPFDTEKTDIFFKSKAGTVKVCENGHGLTFDEDLAKRILSEEEIIILADLKEGNASATCWGCDLTYEYVKINGDYRT